MKTSFAPPAEDRPREQRRERKRGLAKRAVATVRSDAKEKDGWLYVAAAAFFTMILLASNMLVTASASGDAGNSGEGSVLRQVAYLLILGASIVAAIRQGNGAKSLIMPWPILLVLAEPGVGGEPGYRRPPSCADDGDRLEHLHHRALGRL